MRIGLIDIDSKIPNLALMKLSAYYKAKGHKVELTSPLFMGGYNRIFASKIFEYTYMPALSETVKCGGSGLSLKTKLKSEIEHTMPDYSLYPEMNYSLGFTTRGCNRSCPFCIVPKKEGKIRFNADIYEFWDQRHKDTILLDNNIFAQSAHFMRISEQLLKHRLKVDFNQGLDIRLLTKEKAMILKKLVPINYWRFAWDNIKEKEQIVKGIEILKETGFEPYPKHEILFYILVGFYEKNYDQAIESALKRIDIIYKKYGYEVFVMPYNLDKRYAHFARWVNKKKLFYSIPWKEYKYNK